MSNLESSPQETPCGGRATVAVEPMRDVLVGRSVALGGPRGMTVDATAVCLDWYPINTT